MANQNLQPLPDPDDMFADTRMSFGDHIEDLRSHLIRAVVGFLIAMIVCLLPPIGPWAVKFITSPVENQLQAYYERLEETRPPPSKDLLKDIRPVPMTMYVHLPTLKAALNGERADAKTLDSMPMAADAIFRSMQAGLVEGEDRSKSPNWAALDVEIPDPFALAKALNGINVRTRPKKLSTFNVQEAFIVYVKISLMVGFVVASPWVFYQLWSFVAAGLYPQEKRLVNYYLPISLGLFLAGFFVCEFLALPKAIEALLWFNEWLGFEPELRLSEWLGFAIMMPLVFGLSFQTPIVMMFLFKIGVADLDTFRNKRRISYFIMVIFAAVITPSTDLPTMLMLWVPMCFLYEVGIILCKMQPHSLSEEMDEAELDEMVGV